MSQTPEELSHQDLLSALKEIAAVAGECRFGPPNYGCDEGECYAQSAVGEIFSRCVTIFGEEETGRGGEGGFQQYGGIRSAINQVNEFHRAVPDESIQDRRDAPPHMVNMDARKRFLDSEIRELEKAVKDEDINEMADAYADIVYIVLGTAIQQLGIERFSRVWNEVHRSNMAKFPDGHAILREDGKVMKPDGWTPPDIEGAMTITSTTQPSVVE